MGRGKEDKTMEERKENWEEGKKGKIRRGKEREKNGTEMQKNYEVGEEGKKK